MKIPSVWPALRWRNAARVPEPFYDFLQPVRTLTATIAGVLVR